MNFELNHAAITHTVAVNVDSMGMTNLRVIMKITLSYTEKNETYTELRLIP